MSQRSDSLVTGVHTLLFESVHADRKIAQTFYKRTVFAFEKIKDNRSASPDPDERKGRSPR